MMPAKSYKPRIEMLTCKFFNLLYSFKINNLIIQHTDQPYLTIAQCGLIFKENISMKQKYSILKDSKSGILTIKEFAELDKGIFSLIFEETYETGMIETAIKEGKEVLISAIRTPNLYPIAEYAEKIADTIIDYFEKPPAEEPVEIIFNDIKVMQKVKKETAESEDDDEKSVEIDDLLDDDDDSDDSATKDIDDD